MVSIFAPTCPGPVVFDTLEIATAFLRAVFTGNTAPFLAQVAVDLPDRIELAKELLNACGLAGGI
jgi:hypothetical protein